MAAAGELRCVDSAIRSVLEDIDSKLILKEEQRNAIKAHLLILGVQLHALIFVDNNYASLNIRHALRCSYWL